MRVLFVSSGKSGDVGNVVKNQGESLVRYGIDIDYFTIAPGLTGYIKSIPEIRRTVRQGRYDLIHAHYSLSAFAASLAGSFRMVVSLMGSDVHQARISRFIIRILSRLRWAATIVKTDEMNRILKLKDAVIIPNGVDTERFVPMDMSAARKHLNLPPDGKIVLFISTSGRPEKNLPLAKEAVGLLHDDTVRFIHVSGASNDEIPYYLNAADLLLLTSSREGGVNVIKEAMACNCPIVSTDVGDVRWVTSGTAGCYISEQRLESIADNIRKALSFAGRTDGRGRILELGLDSPSVAGKIYEIYDKATNRS
jgi:glycosyltransferase involved in cell wall biosynthesis